jgi:branched-chain amino acid transport system ATP-binding protein
MSLLEATDVTKTFVGITALDGVSIDVDPGEIVALIGPNGAGKTTFFNCLLGMLTPDRGRVYFDGRDLTRIPVHARARAGIGRTFQRIELFAGMTPREHLFVAERSRRGDGRLWKDLLGRGRPRAEEMERVDATLDLLGLTPDADRPIEALSLGRGRVVEVGRALMTDPKLLLLDEPSSGLDVHETAEIAATLRGVCADRGTAILLVEHDIDMVRDLAGRVFVLDFGTLIASGATAAVFADDAVRRAYLGDSSVGPASGGSA